LLTSPIVEASLAARFAMSIEMNTILAVVAMAERLPSNVRKKKKSTDEVGKED
jgi:hypothetical protein